MEHCLLHIDAHSVHVTSPQSDIFTHNFTFRRQIYRHIDAAKCRYTAAWLEELKPTMIITTFCCL